MIHLLVVSPEISEKELKKLSRRYAMTGGYELVLKEGLSSAELARLVEIYLPRVLQLPAGSATRRSSNASRILNLVAVHPLLDEEIKLRIRSIFDPFASDVSPDSPSISEDFTRAIEETQ